MSVMKTFYENQANTVVKAFKKRQIEGYYCDSKDEAKKLAMSFVKEGSIVSWGGSKTLGEIGLLDALTTMPITCLDRRLVTDHDDVQTIYHDALNSDYYFMSSNAITLDGKLVNIDGNGNRLAALIYGPKNIIIVAGMNKVVADEEAAIKRIKTQASPPNSVRLGFKTPCVKSGTCQDCTVPDCICCQIVTTRFSRTPNRIKVILVGENLGF